MSSHERQRACLQCPAALRAWESGGGWVRSENGAFTGGKWVTGCKTLEKKKKKKNPGED